MGSTSSYEPDYNPYRGAYGYFFPGLGAARTLGPADPGWPAIAVERRAGVEPERPHRIETRMDERAATLLLAEYGKVLLDRDARSATYLTPTELDDEELAH